MIARMPDTIGESFLRYLREISYFAFSDDGDIWEPVDLPNLLTYTKLAIHLLNRFLRIPCYRRTIAEQERQNVVSMPARPETINS